MSKFSNSIEFNLRTTLDASGITQLQGQLASISTQLDQMESKKLISPKEVYAAQRDIKQLGDALSSSLNPQTGLLDLSKFQKQLGGLSLSQLEQSMSKVGATGQQAFGNILGQIGRMDTSFKSISSFADKIYNTMGNTVRWGVTASIFQTIQNSLYRAVGYVQELDTSLNNIRIVTNASNEDMRNFALNANQAAQALGSSTTSFTDAAQLYAQNGFNEEDYTRLAEITTKVANVTQQNTTDVSEQITALMEGYGMSIDQVEDSLSGMSVVAAESAADLEELATAEQKVASTASTLGVSQDQLTAQIGTIVSVTRQAPESVGNAMRTLYARIADLKMGDTLEDGVTLGDVSKQLSEIGVQVLDEEGNLRNLGDVLEDLQAKWGDLSNAQQIALGNMLAGKHQLNPFMALMENADMYNKQLDMMQNSQGALDEQQSIYMDSMQAKLQQLSTAGEGLITTLFNPDKFKPFIEMLTDAVNLATDFVNAIGGLGPVLTGVGSIAVKVFSDQIGRGLNNALINFTRSNNRQTDPQALLDVLGGMGEQSNHKSTVDLINKVSPMQNSMSVEQQKQYNDALQQTVSLENQVIASLDQEEKARENLVLFVRKNTNISNPLTDKEQKPNDAVRKEQAEVATNFEKTNEAIGRSIDILGDWEEKRESISAGTQNYVKSFSTVNDLLNEYGSYLQKAGIDTDDFKNAILSVGRTASDTEGLDQQIAALKEFIETLRTSLQEQGQYKQELDDAIGTLDVAMQQRKNAQTALKAQSDSNKATGEGLVTQSQLQSIVTITGSLGQLIFAWQSFQSLGSLWADADLSDGEKIQQTIMNLVFVVPQLVSAFADLRQITKTIDFSELALSIANYGINALSGAEASTAFASSGLKAFITSRAIATGANAASVAVVALSKAAQLLISPLGIAVAAGAAFVAILTSISNAAKQEKLENMAESADKAAESFRTAQSAYSNFDTLYEQYKNGSANAEDLSKAAEQLNTVLDDQTAKAQAAAGQWDSYAASIKNAEKTVAQRNLSSAMGGLQAAQQKLDEQTGFNDNTEAVLPAVRGVYYQKVLQPLQEAFANNDSLVQYPDYTFAIKMGTDGVKAAEEVQKASEAYTKAIQQTQEEMDNVAASAGENTEQYKRLESQLNSLQTSQESLLGIQADLQPYIDEYNQSQQDALDMYIAANSDNEKLDYQDGESIDDYKNRISPMLEAAGFNVTDDLLDAYVNGMAKGTSENASKLAEQLGEEAANNAFSTSVSSKINDTINTQGVDYNNYVSNGSITQDQYAQAMGDQMRQQIANSGLTEKEQIEFMAGIDWSKSLPEIQAEIDNINSSDELPKLSFEPTLTDRSTFSDKQISDLLDEVDMSQNAFDRMSQSTFESSPIQDQADAIEQEIQALQDSGDASEDTAAKIADLRQEYEDLGETSQDITAYNIQMNKGLSNLGDSWEDLSKILKNDAAKGTADYYEALGQLDDIMSDILNIDTGVLSDGFYQNADALDAMERAANGDVDAIDDLRAMAAQDIIMHLDVQNITPEDKDYLINNELLPMLSEFQAILDGQPLGTTVDIDTNPFIMKLNQLLEDGQLTAEQATNILSSIGMDADITTVPSTVTQHHKMEFPKFEVETDPDTGMMTGITPVGVEPIEWDSQDDVSFPQITGATYTGAGVQTVGYNSGGGGRKSNGSGGGGGKKGGSGGSGGGGSSAKAYEPKTKDAVEDEVDRYERVNAELDTLSNRLDKVADEQDRLTGFDIADNISKQIGLIKEQIKWENEKLKIQKQEAQEYRDQLASQYGIAYDAEGHITNYAETYKRLLDNLNGLINQYNATTTEEGQEALDKQIEAAQDNFDKYNDLIEKYDKLNSNSILETEKDIEDFYDKIEDLQIEAFQKAVDAADNIKDLQESLIDFNAVFTGLDSDSPFRDMITSLDNLKTYWDVNTKAVDDYYDELIHRNKEAMKNASTQRKQELQYQNEVLEAARKQYGKQSFEAGGTGLFDMAMSNLNTILEQIHQYEESGTSTIFGENAGSMYEVGNDIFKQATELLSDYEGHLDDLKDAILDAIDEIGDKMDERLDTYENINDELDHYADMIEMVQGENAYDQLNQTSQAMINNNQAQINELKQNIALWQDMLAAMEKGSDEWKAINEHITDAQQDLLELTSDTVEKMLDIYERGVNKILDKWVGSTGMGDDLDWISEEWELINRNADYYLDDVNAAYEIQKLQGKYLDLLDDSNGLDIQNQITQQMQQQLGYLREKDKLSEYDVQYANAQLEILQKTIALQEAQRNKSQLQLRRDTQGNYSYVYTADENDTRAAQSDLLDAQNNAYNLSKDQMKQTQDDSLSALQDARDTLEQIWTNANLTLEDKTKRTQTVIDSLKDYLAGTSEQLSESEKNIINDFLGMCEVLTDENDSRLQEVYDQIVNGNKDAFDQIDTRWQTSITNWLQHMEDFNTSTDESFQNLIDNFGGYQENLDELGNLAGMTFDDMSDSIQNAVDKTNDLANSTADFINQLKNDSGTVKEYEKSLAEMTAKVQDAENGMRAYQEQVNKLQSDLTEKEQENANLSSQVKDLQSQIDAMNNPAGAGGDGSGEGGGANTDTAWGIARAIWTYGGASGWGNDPIRSGKLIKAYGKDFAQQVQSIINQNTRSGKLVDYGSMKYSSYNLIGYRSGGYTGDDWTAAEKASGKIGLLHEKELVLNKTDTENILNAVDMVRSMVALGRNGNYNDIIRQSDNVVDMASVVKPLSDDMGQTIYQVECTFPNATGVDEIQKAILTLPDIAPQYAYKS